MRILIDNALRYGDGAADPRDRRARTRTVEVADRGPGVPPEERERIFERFYRGRARGSEGGFGLGLAIGRELAERMGGTLTLADRPGGGTRFVLSLPRSHGGARRPGRRGPSRRFLALGLDQHGRGDRVRPALVAAAAGRSTSGGSARSLVTYWLNSSERSRTSLVHGARQRCHRRR